MLLASTCTCSSQFLPVTIVNFCTVIGHNKFENPKSFDSLFGNDWSPKDAIALTRFPTGHSTLCLPISYSHENANFPQNFFMAEYFLTSKIQHIYHPFTMYSLKKRFCRRYQTLTWKWPGWDHDDQKAVSPQLYGFWALGTFRAAIGGLPFNSSTMDTMHLIYVHPLFHPTRL